MDPTPAYDRIAQVVRTVEAPDALRARIAAERDRTLVRRMVVKRMKQAGALAGVAACLGIGVGLASLGGHHGGPSSLDAAALAARGSVTDAPRRSGADRRFLQARVDGVPFPTWSGRFPWKASGQRTDSLDGRQTLTVYYDDPQRVRLGYTIVSGAALPWPEHSHVVTRNGVEVWTVHQGDRIVAVWREQGHTCVISAPDTVPEDRMITLASSTGVV